MQLIVAATVLGCAGYGTDTFGLAQSYILYSGREVLPIGGYPGKVSAASLATLQADIRRGCVRVFVAAGVTARPGPAGAVDQVALHWAGGP